MAILKAHLKDASSDYEFECTRGESLSEVRDSKQALSLVFEFMNSIMITGQEYIN